MLNENKPNEQMRELILDTRISLKALESKLANYEKKKKDFETMLDTPIHINYMPTREVENFLRTIEDTMRFMKPILDNTKQIIQQLQPTKKTKPLEEPEIFEDV